MATEKREHRRYVFTVEGETERWYLEWLQEQLNLCPESKFTVSIVSKVQQSPQKFAKTVNPISTPKVTHICDYESNDAFHVKKFRGILSELKNASSFYGREFRYNLGYSNFTFELWIVLHKQDYGTILTDRKQYLSPINKSFGENFENLDQYKHEKISSDACQSSRLITQEMLLHDLKRLWKTKLPMGFREKNIRDSCIIKIIPR